MRGCLWFFVLFPALELWVLILVGKEIGALHTVALVFLSMFIGFGLLRLRGERVASRWSDDLSAGRTPAAPILDTLSMMAAGWLFVFPGFISDFIALLLLLPLTRRAVATLIIGRMKASGFTQTVYTRSMHSDEEGRVHWSSQTYQTPPQGKAASKDEAGQQLPRNQVVIDCTPEEPGKKSGPDQ